MAKNNSSCVNNKFNRAPKNNQTVKSKATLFRDGA
jgi:hypothetical protein